MGKMKEKGKLFIISAPSGAGKTSLVNAILKTIGPHHPISRMITYTTKQPRAIEQDGYDFHFLTVSAFESRIREGFFLEWSNAYQAYYGTPRSIINDIEQGVSYILVIDRVGAQQIKRHINDAILIWLEVHHIDVLKERLLKRGTESEAQMEQRLKRAQQEIQLEQQEPLYEYHIINDNFNKAVENLYTIFAEKLDIAQMPKSQKNRLSNLAY